MTVEQIISEMIDKGVTGLLVAALITGILVPKWVLDEYRKREAANAALIERLAARLDSISDVFEDFTKPPNGR